MGRQNFSKTLGWVIRIFSRKFGFNGKNNGQADQDSNDFVTAIWRRAPRKGEFDVRVDHEERGGYADEAITEERTNEELKL